ncbi:hypothetical protein VHEMI01360 [[Torrubiella] hemipterigena]|uniref:Uncharacterized protein n=1 Tax=[Torrubiella] hemipterigena TaxID=1531966 RepID=A0A0A1SLQ9_9HYPO|nr:hypothetical protein VHEMI01360 [[Torrubiella] hemipterigena]
MPLTSLPVEILEKVCLNIARSPDIAEHRGSRLFNFGERAQTEVVAETSSAAASSAHPSSEDDDEDEKDDDEDDYYTDSPWRVPSVSDGSFDSDSSSKMGEGSTSRPFQPDEDADKFSDRDLAALALTCRHMYAIANKILYRRGGTAVRLADYTETVLTHPHLMEHVEHLTVAKSRRSGAVTEELAQLCNEIFVSHNVVSPQGKPVTCWAGEQEKPYPAWPPLSSRLVIALLLRLPNVKTMDIHYGFHLGSTPVANNPPCLPKLQAVRVMDCHEYGRNHHQYGYHSRLLPQTTVQWMLDAAPNLIAIDTSNIAFVTALRHPSVSVFAIHSGWAHPREIQQLMESMPGLRSLKYHSSSLHAEQMKSKDLYRAVRASGNEFLVVDARFNVIATERLGTSSIPAGEGQANNLSSVPVSSNPSLLPLSNDLSILQVSNDLSIVPVSYDPSVGLAPDDHSLLSAPLMPLVDIHKLRIKAIRINLLPVHEPSGSPWDCRFQCIIPATAEIIAVDHYKNWDDITALADYVIRCCRVVKAIYIRNLGHDFQILDNEEPARRLKANGITCQAYSHIDLLQLADPFGFVRTSF